MYPNVRSRAGLVTIVFALIISFVSAAPLPIPALSSSLLAHSTRDGNDFIQHDIGRIAHISRHAPTSIVSATTGALTGNTTPVEVVSHQLVRRNKRLNAKIRNAFKKFGRAIKHVAQKIGHGIKKVAQKIGRGIKKVAQKIGSGIKKAAKKVGGFIKHTLGKVVKFGLKIVSVVEKVAAKVIGFIPGIGKPLGKALEGASKVTGLISDKIHVKLGKKLEKGMKVMDKADKVMGYIPRDFSEGFQKRDISAGYDYFEERDDIFDADIYERTFDYYLDWE